MLNTACIRPGIDDYLAIDNIARKIFLLMEHLHCKVHFNFQIVNMFVYYDVTSESPLSVLVFFLPPFC